MLCGHPATYRVILIEFLCEFSVEKTLVSKITTTTTRALDKEIITTGNTPTRTRIGPKRRYSLHVPGRKRNGSPSADSCVDLAREKRVATLSNVGRVCRIWGDNALFSQSMPRVGIQGLAVVVRVGKRAKEPIARTSSPAFFLASTRGRHLRPLHKMDLVVVVVVATTQSIDTRTAPTMALRERKWLPMIRTMHFLVGWVAIERACPYRVWHSTGEEEIGNDFFRVSGWR